MIAMKIILSEPIAIEISATNNFTTSSDREEYFTNSCSRSPPVLYSVTEKNKTA